MRVAVASPGDGAMISPMDDAGAPWTLVIVPAYNEEDSLGRVLTELLQVVPASDIVVVSDGSLDSTAAVARRSGVAVVELPFNLGIGGALRTGFKFAVRNGYQRVSAVRCRRTARSR